MRRILHVLVINPYSHEEKEREEETLLNMQPQTHVSIRSAIGGFVVNVWVENPHGNMPGNSSNTDAVFTDAASALEYVKNVLTGSINKPPVISIDVEDPI